MKRSPDPGDSPPPAGAAAIAPPRPRPPRRASSRRTRLDELRLAGVSIWLDALSRELLESGELATLVGDYGVTGVTSNPTSFAEAIRSSDRYDAPLHAGVAAGVEDPHELFLALALDDVAAAAALLRPHHEASGGRDGFVSFECTPDLGDDAAGTVDQATELWARLGLPNVMIKVPATDAGIVAIEELTARGVNVNVTLLFSVGRYDQVVDAYIRGVERRVAAAEPVGDLASVASIFVSRVDAAVDPLLAPGSDLRGQVGIANARLAYDRCRERFADERWRKLRAHGAHSQRPLYASTRTKDPAYSDVRYVEQLVAPGVINTMAASTLRAFVDHGDARSPGWSAAGPADTLDRAESEGIRLSAITADLERDGLDAFHTSYADLLECIEVKRARIGATVSAPRRRGGRPRAGSRRPRAGAGTRPSEEQP